MCVCQYVLIWISLDSVYVAAEFQTATHQSHSFLRSDPTLLNTDEEEMSMSFSSSLSYLGTNTGVINIIWKEHFPTCVVTVNVVCAVCCLLQWLCSSSPDTESSVSAVQQFHEVFNPIPLQQIVLEPVDQPQSNHWTSWDTNHNESGLQSEDWSTFTKNKLSRKTSIMHERQYYCVMRQKQHCLQSAVNLGSKN